MNWKGDWKNKEGYTLVKIPGTHNPVEYEFQLDYISPLEYKLRAGGEFQPDRHFKTDMGSIPKPLQIFISKDDFLLSFLLHDCACIHKGLFFKAPHETSFTFRKLGRSARDSLLRDCVMAEGGGWLRAQAVYVGVRAYALVTGQWD